MVTGPCWTGGWRLSCSRCRKLPCSSRLLALLGFASLALSLLSILHHLFQPDSSLAPCVSVCFVSV